MQYYLECHWVIPSPVLWPQLFVSFAFEKLDHKTMSVTLFRVPGLPPSAKQKRRSSYIPHSVCLKPKHNRLGSTCACH